MNRNLFRKNARLKVASPFELNRLVSIFSGREALALLALGVTVVAALAWGICGVIYERVSGNGIVMLQSRFDTIQAPAGGVLISFDLETGDFVRRGQMVGRLFSFSDLENLRESYQKLKMLQGNLEEVRRYTGRLKKGKQNHFQKSSEVLDETIGRLNEELEWLSRYVDKGRGLSERGAISQQQWHEEQEKYHAKLKSRADYLLRKLEEENSLSEADFTLAKEVMSVEVEVKSALYEVELLRNKLEYNTRIVSTHSGTVTSVNYTPGSIVAAEANLASLIDLDDQTDETWELYAYFSVADSKKIRPGMSAIVTPSSVKAERDGSIRGTVTHVGTYILPVESIDRTFRNAAFAQYLLKQCANMPVEVRILLSRDRSSPNGFRWTSGSGPNIEVSAGTLCAASVVVDKEPPLELVFSGLRKFMFGRGVMEEFQLRNARTGAGGE